MAASWKIKRELFRVVRQIVELPGSLFQTAVTKPYYELVQSKHIRTTPGELPFAPEVCIYLIFPKDGLLESHFSALEQIREEGIAPVVVCNLKLGDADRETLTKHSALVIERLNIGYDFGGYRDAILILKDRLPELTRLFILNDSVWMIPREQSWFEQVRRLNVDYGAATSNYGIRPRLQGADPNLDWNYTPEHRNFHYASYALCFGSKVLNDPGFLKFWKSYNLANHKKKTVKRGEIGLTRWILKNNFSHAATFSSEDIDESLRALDRDEIAHIAQELVICEKPRLRDRKFEILETDANSENGGLLRLSLILAAVASQATIYSLPAYSLFHRDFMFLKKSPLWLDKDASDTMMRIIDRLPEPSRSVIHAEANQIRQQRGMV